MTFQQIMDRQYEVESRYFGQRAERGAVLQFSPTLYDSEEGEITESRVATRLDAGVRYQRCGGGHRVLRKRVGGN